MFLLKKIIATVGEVYWTRRKGFLLRQSVNGNVGRKSMGKEEKKEEKKEETKEEK